MLSDLVEPPPFESYYDPTPVREEGAVSSLVLKIEGEPTYDKTIGPGGFYTKVSLPVRDIEIPWLSQGMTRQPDEIIDVYEDFQAIFKESMNPDILGDEYYSQMFDGKMPTMPPEFATFYKKFKEKAEVDIVDEQTYKDSTYQRSLAMVDFIFRKVAEKQIKGTICVVFSSFVFDMLTARFKKHGIKLKLDFVELPKRSADWHIVKGALINEAVKKKPQCIVIPYDFLDTMFKGEIKGRQVVKPLFKWLEDSIVEEPEFDVGLLLKVLFGGAVVVTTVLSGTKLAAAREKDAALHHVTAGHTYPGFLDGSYMWLAMSHIVEKLLQPFVYDLPTGNPITDLFKLFVADPNGVVVQRPILVTAFGKIRQVAAHVASSMSSTRYSVHGTKPEKSDWIRSPFPHKAEVKTLSRPIIAADETMTSIEAYLSCPFTGELAVMVLTPGEQVIAFAGANDTDYAITLNKMVDFGFVVYGVYVDYPKSCFSISMSSIKDDLWFEPWFLQNYGTHTFFPSDGLFGMYTLKRYDNLVVRDSMPLTVPRFSKRRDAKKMMHLVESLKSLDFDMDVLASIGDEDTFDVKKWVESGRKYYLGQSFNAACFKLLYGNSPYAVYMNGLPEIETEYLKRYRKAMSDCTPAGVIRVIRDKKLMKDPEGRSRKSKHENVRRRAPEKTW
jgi:hypothetical protein